MSGLPAPYTVTQDWQAAYADPIDVGAGDRVFLSGKRDEWDGHVWLWARNDAGKEGWIPDTLCEGQAGETRTRRAFSALELTCAQGQVVQVTQITHSWALAQNQSGNQGWVPLRNLVRG